MDQRHIIFQYAKERFGVTPDYPWPKFPTYAILRHTDSAKWFAAVLNVSRGNLGLTGEGAVDVLNVKCGPLMLGSLLGQPSYLPAYHMNKEHWVSVMLDGGVSDGELKNLITISFDMTR